MLARVQYLKGAHSLLLLAANAVSQQQQCPPNIHGLAFDMLESNIGRGDGMLRGGDVSAFIELGIFQQALRECIAYTDDTAQSKRWDQYLHDSIASSVSSLNTEATDIGLPLDRLSVGSSMILQREAGIRGYGNAIEALQQSVTSQPRNADGSLWYYNNLNNITAYHNLSYLDGMFSYPKFAILSCDNTGNDTGLSPSAALKQLEILHSRCKDSSGLLRHGFDASKMHQWANPKTGCSPAVWGRALAWYTMGIIEALETLQYHHSDGIVYQHMKKLLNDLIRAQVQASNRSLQIQGNYGVWQIVDYPGAIFAGYNNFVEASASCMTTYNLLKAVRLALIDDLELQQAAKRAGLGIYQVAMHDFLIYNQNGTLSFNGTSSVASLAGDVDFTYYVTRPTLLNSLKGTSAFILASLEVEMAC